MPGSNRHFVVSHYRRSPNLYLEDLTTEVEITDVRVWNDNKNAPLIENTALSAAEGI